VPEFENCPGELRVTVPVLVATPPKGPATPPACEQLPPPQEPKCAPLYTPRDVDIVPCCAHPAEAGALAKANTAAAAAKTRWRRLMRAAGAANVTPAFGLTDDEMFTGCPSRFGPLRAVRRGDGMDYRRTRPAGL
jgi:hypothetical protein